MVTTITSTSTVTAQVNIVGDCLPDPTSISTFHCIGLYWSPDPSTYSDDECPIQYRRTGDVAWKDALPLWYDDRVPQYKGSILNLIPNTLYDIQLLPTGLDPVVYQAATWDEDFPIDPTKIHYYTEDLTTTVVASDSGSAENGYALYAPEPGYDVTSDVNNLANYNFDVRGSYIIIRGFESLTGAIKNAVHLNHHYTVHHIVVEENDISNWGGLAKCSSRRRW